MAKKSVVTAAPMKVDVGGTVYELRPTLAALRAISAALGGLKPAFQRIQDLDYEATAAVIAAGAGLKLRPSEADALVEAVWTSDQRGEIGGAAIEFLVVLLNGGTPPSDDQPAAEESEGNG